MERHFLLPVTIAAAFHGVLLGIPRGPVPHATPASVIVRPGDPWPAEVIPLVPVRNDSPDDAPTPAAGGEPRPSIDEPTPAEAKGPFVFPVIENRGPRAPSDVWTIPLPKPGTGLGDGMGGGPGIMNSGSLDKTPRVRVQVPPEYPAAARHDGIDGEVTVEFVVDEAGRVSSPRVVRSTAAVFESSALAAVARWRFEPGTFHGNVVRFRMAVPIVFRLSAE